MPKAITPFLITVLITASLGLSSCATLKTAGGNSVAAVNNSSSGVFSKISDLPLIHLLPGQGPKVVEVREEDLKKMPTGHELAMAQKKRSRSYWIFGGPVDFSEPTLPVAGTELNGSLLPPRTP